MGTPCRCEGAVQHGPGVVLFCYVFHFDFCTEDVFFEMLGERGNIRIIRSSSGRWSRMIDKIRRIGRQGSPDGIYEHVMQYSALRSADQTRNDLSPRAIGAHCRREKARIAPAWGVVHISTGQPLEEFDSILARQTQHAPARNPCDGRNRTESMHTLQIDNQRDVACDAESCSNAVFIWADRAYSNGT